MSLSDAERRLMEEIPPQHMVSACPFQWAAERAGFDWETGKKMLQTFLDRKLIWDLNNDTLDDPLGICDRTRFGDLEMGVYISISAMENGTYRVHRPPTAYEYGAGQRDGLAVYTESRDEAIELGGLGLRGINIVSMELDGTPSVIGYIKSEYEEIPRIDEIGYWKQHPVYVADPHVVETCGWRW
ncbi:hypothetical protein HFN89_02510 [Rhizobium laguerreae]|nr:hypothetical protein [Rhizobium laguerreae]